MNLPLFISIFAGKNTRTTKLHIRALVFWFIAFLVVAWIALSVPLQLCLAVSDEAGMLVFAQPVHPDDSFNIRFIHSVHKTPVEEYFGITDEETMMLYKVVYETYGVGTPSVLREHEQFRLDNGKLIIENIQQRFTIIHQRIGQIVANHQLIMNGRSIPFDSWSRPGSVVSLQITRIPLWTLFLKEMVG